VTDYYILRHITSETGAIWSNAVFIVLHAICNINPTAESKIHSGAYDSLRTQTINDQYKDHR
jgi:hypothetical protein